MASFEKLSGPLLWLWLCFRHCENQLGNSFGYSVIRWRRKLREFISGRDIKLTDPDQLAEVPFGRLGECLVCERLDRAEPVSLDSRQNPQGETKE